MNPLPETTIDRLVERYDVLLFDAYGVLVHTSGAMPGAADVIERLNQVKKPYFLLTNDASKLPETAARRYQGYGLAIAPERILASGALLTGYFENHNLKGASCVVLGPEDSLQYVRRAGGRIVSAEDDFDVLVVADEAGYPFIETVDAVLTSLCGAIDHQRKVHLILPNPDLVYPKAGQGLGFAAGSIAGLFEAILNQRYPDRTDLRFIRLGKPEKHLFEEAFSRIRTRNMVMIGDQLATDIQGARQVGIDAVWIQTGVTTGAFAHIPEHMIPTCWMQSLH